MNKRTKMMLTLGLAALVAGGGTAMAAGTQEGTNNDGVFFFNKTATTATTPSTTQDALTEGQPAAGDQAVQPFAGGPGKHRGGKMFGMKLDNTELLAFLGVTEEEFRTSMQGGKTLAALATEKGKTEDQLVTFMLEQQTKQLANAVTAGKLTQAQADQMKEKLTADHIKEMINQVGGKFGHGGKGGKGGFKMKGIGMNGLTEFLGLTQEELHTALEGGKSIAQVAADKGITEDKLVEHIQEQLTKKLEEGVAAGTITQEQADKIKEHETADHIKEHINRTGGMMKFKGKPPVDQAPAQDGAQTAPQA